MVIVDGMNDARLVLLKGCTALRASCLAGWFGWFTSARIEDLRGRWYGTTDAAAQKRLADGIQRAVWDEVPYIPLSQVFQAIAIRGGVPDIIESSFPILWNAQDVTHVAGRVRPECLPDSPADPQVGNRRVEE